MPLRKISDRGMEIKRSETNPFCLLICLKNCHIFPENVSVRTHIKKHEKLTIQGRQQQSLAKTMHCPSKNLVRKPWAHSLTSSLVQSKLPKTMINMGPVNSGSCYPIHLKSIIWYQNVYDLFWEKGILQDISRFTSWYPLFFNSICNYSTDFLKIQNKTKHNNNINTEMIKMLKSITSYHAIHFYFLDWLFRSKEY